MFILRKIKKIAGKIIRITYKLTYKLFKVDDKLMIFISFHGKGIQIILKRFMKKSSKMKDLKDIVLYGLLRIINVKT